MKIKKFNMWWFVLVFLLTGCASVTPDQALKTVKDKYPESLFVYVDATSNEISNALLVTSLKMAASTSSDAVLRMLILSSSNRPGVVSGQSNMVTVATIRRAIEDAGGALPKNGKLVIVGEAKTFEEIANFARSRGLNVEVMSPAQKVGSASQFQEPITIAPSTNPATRLQNQVQNNSNMQMNQLLQGSGGRK